MLQQKTFKGLALASVLLLAACGEGWDTKLYDSVPYSMERTAGNGVAFVRANMMPARGPIVEESSGDIGSVSMSTEVNSELYMEVTDEPEVVPEPPKTADEMFDDAQRK